MLGVILYPYSIDMRPSIEGSAENQCDSEMDAKRHRRTAGHSPVTIGLITRSELPVC